MKTLRVDYLDKPRWLIFAIPAAFLALVLSLSVFINAQLLITMFVIFTGMFLVAAPAGHLSMNEQSIRRHQMVGEVSMKWEEVERIELLPEADKHMMLRGQKKFLHIPVTDLWRGADAAAMRELFDSQIEARGIIVEPVRQGNFTPSSHAEMKHKPPTESRI